MFGSDGPRGKRSKDGSASSSGLFGMPAPGLMGMPPPGGAHTGFQASSGNSSTSFQIGSPAFGTGAAQSSFGSFSAPQQPAFGATMSFGATTASQPSFGAPSTTTPPPSFGASSTTQSLFGASTTQSSFGTTTTPPSFGATATSNSLFGSAVPGSLPAVAAAEPISQTLFGGNKSKTPPKSFGTMGSAPGGIGESNTGSKTPSLFKAPTESNLFKSIPSDGSSLFSSQSEGSGLFTSSGSSNMFSAPPKESGELFGSNAVAEVTPGTPPIFKSKPSGPSPFFGAIESSSTQSSLFVAPPTDNLFSSIEAETDQSKKLFNSPKTNIFGSTDTSGGKILFGKPAAAYPASDEISSFISGERALFGQSTDTEAKLLARPALEQPDITIVKPSISSRLGKPSQATRPSAPTGLMASRLAPLPPSADQDDEDDEDLGDEEEEFDEDDERDVDDCEEDDDEEEEGEWNEENEPEDIQVTLPQPDLPKDIPVPVPQPQEKKKLIRTFSKEELKSVNCIICEKVPEILNNKVTMTKHFSRFGPVIKVVPNTRSNSAVIHFADHKSAKNAKDKGKIVHPKMDPIGDIFYSVISPSGKGRIRRTTSRSDITEEVPAKPVQATRSLPLKKKVFSIKQALKPPTETETRSIDIGLARNTVNISEILSIMRTMTQNDSDRYTVLEARDKYIRLKNPKSLTRSGMPLENVNLKGTCPDLCPERERYSRSAKNQLRWFEKQDNTVHHAAVIKEHSRSAADQDVPLSHELRPPSILCKTLDFLMCNMVDRVDYMAGSMKSWFSFVVDAHSRGFNYSEPMANFVPDTEQEFHSVGDWFEYIWSTTRALRKDITQQGLTDTASVGLVEKCARFHIFCSERLVEEDAHDFDPKLNSENLTKCLQSLKHMYYDLSLEGVSCENEAEFRSYEILLNLNQGDTLREAQGLEHHLRNDPCVVHALNIYFALNSNNYVRFFRLFKKSSYLEMCIIKRYFYQVRRIALEIMIKSFVPPKQMVQYPLRKLVDLLAFESDAECASFLRSHGVESELDLEPVVFMERATFYYPETAPRAVRSKKLIDSKKTCSYGEVMNGGPLPENPYLTYLPHNSFDVNGYLKLESYEAKDQEVKQSPEELNRIKEETERKARILNLSTQIRNELTQEVVEKEIHRIAQDTIRETELQAMARDIYSSMENEVCRETAAEISSTVMRETRNAILMERLEIERLVEEEEYTVKDIITDMVDVNIKQVAKESLAEAENQKKLDKQKKAALRICDEIVSEGLVRPINDVARLALQEVETEREVRVRTLEENLKKKLASKCFKAWRSTALKAKKQREAISDFPVSASQLSAEQQNHRLVGFKGSKSSLAEVQKERHQLDSMFRMLDVKESILQSAILLPFNIVEVLEKSGKELGSCLGLKLLLSCNNLEAGDEYFSFEQMVKRKFSKMFPDSPEDPGLLVLRTVPFQRSVLSVCVRNVTDENIKSATFSEKERRRLFSGSCGILFLHLDPSEDPGERLQALLVNRPRVPAVPVHVLTCWTVDKFRQKTKIAELDPDLCSSYDIQQVNSDLYNIDNIVSVTESFRKLIEARPLDPTQNLTKKCLGDFISGFITNQIFGEMGRNLKERRGKGLTDRPYGDLINLYNNGLEHLKRVLIDPDLQEVSWPIPEFGGSSSDFGPVGLSADWNDALRIDEIVRAIEDLKLEDFEVYESDSWKNLVEQVWVYIDNISIPEHDTSVLCSELRRTLARSYRKFATQCCLMGGKEKTTPPPEILPWTDILICSAQYRIGCLAETDRVVGYRDSLLIDFHLPKEWTSGLSWMTEHSETSVRDHLNCSVGAYRDSLQQPDILLNPQLRLILNREQKLSLRLEARLEAALSPDYVARSDSLIVHRSDSINSSAMENSFLTLDDSLMMGGEEEDTIESVPIISYVSPSLGRMASHVDCRRERRTTGMSPRLSKSPRLSAGGGGVGKENRRSWEGDRKRKAEESTTKDKRKRGSSGGRGYRFLVEAEPELEMDDKLDVLKRSINLEISESSRFEQMLQAALQ